MLKPETISTALTLIGIIFVGFILTHLISAIIQGHKAQENHDKDNPEN